MYEAMNWDDLRYFLCVARTGGLSHASAALGASPSTVARRISALETALGTTLFTRHSTGYLLTDEGKLILDGLEDVESGIHSMRMRLGGRDQELSGTVRLATSVTIANDLVVPALPRLRSESPGINLEITSGIQNINLTRREADLALRLTHPPSGPLVVRRIAAVPHAVYATQAFVAAHCPEMTKQQIAACPFVIWDESFRDLPMSKWLHTRFRGATPALVANDLTTHVAAVKAGIGAAILPCFCVKPADDLRCLVPAAECLERDLYLILHAEVQHSSRVRKVADVLATACAGGLRNG